LITSTLTNKKGSDKDMQMKDVYDLLARFEQSTLTELTLEMEGVSFHGKKGGNATVCTTPVVQEAVESPVVINVAPATPAVSREVVAGTPVTAQIAGTFYRASAPDAEPFVKVGQEVKKGDTLGLLEAMKMMSNVISPVDGEVKDIPVENGTLVSFGEALFYIG